MEIRKCNASSIWLGQRLVDEKWLNPVAESRNFRNYMIDCIGMKIKGDIAADRSPGNRFE